MSARSMTHLGTPFRRVILVATTALLLVGTLPAAAQETNGTSRVNIQFEADIPAALVALATSADGRDILALDDSSTFTFLPAAGSDDAQQWTAPAAGLVGESAANAVEGTVTPDGEYWAGAIAYEHGEEGKVYGFARWSDVPVWSLRLPENQDALHADQPTTLDAGGSYIYVGTAQGLVHQIKARPSGSSPTQDIYRTYDSDNHGNLFGTVHDIAVSRAGDRVLIATDGQQTAGLHLYSDIFYKRTFSRFDGPVSQVAISPDGTYGVAITGSDASTRAHLVDLVRYEVVWEYNIGAPVHSIALSDEARTLIIGTTNGEAFIHRENGDPFDRIPIIKHHLGAGNDVTVAISDDGTQAVAAGGDTLLFLHPERAAPLWTYQPGGTITRIALSEDGESLVIGARNDAGDRILYATARHALAAVAPTNPVAAPGATTQLGIMLTNTGNRMENVKTVWGDLPPRWSARHNEVAVAPGTTVDLPVHLDIPAGQGADRYTVPLTLVSDHTDVRLVFTVRVPEVQGGTVTTTWSLPVVVPGGAPAGFTLKLENTGNTANKARLGHSGLPTTWQAGYGGPAEITLQPAETRTVDLKVKAPRDAAIGSEMHFEALVVWSHGEERVPITLKVVSGAEYRKALDALTGGTDVTGNATPLSTALGEAALEPLADVPIKETKDSPGVGVAVAVVGLIGLLAVARRRRTA